MIVEGHNEMKSPLSGRSDSSPLSTMLWHFPRDVSMSATQGEQAWGAMKKLSFLPLALVGMTGTGMVSPEPAFADGSVSAGTVQRAGALYGPRVRIRTGR